MRALVLVVASAALLTGAPSAAPADGPPGVIAIVRGSSARTDLYTVRAAGGKARQLTKGRRSTDPSWSPSGTRIAYVSSAEGNPDLYVADADGRNARRLTDNPARDVLPAWSPDGKRIAFASDRAGGFAIWVTGSDGGRARRVTRGANRAYFDAFPAWSPDGRWIAFASTVGTPENQELYVVRPDGSRRTRLTRTPGSAHRLGDDSTPAWSPDGKLIAFASDRAGGLAIWVMQADGRGQRRLAGLQGRDDDRPTFSPDGRWLAFASQGADGTSAVYVVRADGTGLRRLTAGTAPAWHP